MDIISSPNACISPNRPLMSVGLHVLITFLVNAFLLLLVPDSHATTINGVVPTT